MASIEGTLAIAADGDYKLHTPVFPVAGTLTISFVGTGWNAAGELVPQIRLPAVVNPRGTAIPASAWYETIYQEPDSATDTTAGTPITGDALIYVRCDQCEVGLAVSGYAAGTMTVSWKWLAG
jgi:hypothetical protein